MKLRADDVLVAMGELARRRALAAGGGREERVERHRARGGLTGQERADLIADRGSFVPVGRMLHGEDLDELERTIGGDGHIRGVATVDGRPVWLGVMDPTVKGGTGSMSSNRVNGSTMRAHCGLPYFDLHQSGGARITEIITSKFAGTGPNGATMGGRHVFGPNSVMLTAVLGDYYPPWNVVQSDFTAMVRSAHAALTSAPLLEVATGQREDPDDLAGAEMQANVNGQIDMVLDDEASTLAMLRQVFTYLPSRAGEEAPRVDTGDPPDRAVPELRDVLPDNPNRAFDMRKVLEATLDRESFLEWSPGYAKNLVTGIGRLDGRSVLVAGNQPMVRAGTLDVATMVKFRRVLEVANSFSLPIVTFIDTPGVLTTKDQEHNRLIWNVIETCRARLRPDVPKVAIVVRKGIGFAYMLMSAGDAEGLTFCWPTARIAFTGPEPAARIVHAQEIEHAADPKARQQELAGAMRELADVRLAAELGYVDAIIAPADTRRVLNRSIDLLTRSRT